MECNIIATGNSLRGFDFSTIKGVKIGVNFAWKYVDCQFVVGLDHPIKHKWGVGLDPEKIFTNKVHAYGNGLEKRGRGLQREFGYVAGDFNGSLYAAIDFALSIGYKVINVYGADEEIVGAYVHFYDTEPVTNHLRRRYQSSFNKLKGYREKLLAQLKPDELIIFH